MKSSIPVKRAAIPLMLLFFALFATPGAMAVPVTVTVESLAPPSATFLTPVWVGFHNGNFDIYDPGQPAPLFLQRLAEDGNSVPIAAAFLASGDGSAEATIPGPINPQFAHGQIASMTFDLDPVSPTSGYFSYGSMVIPSNDAFIANGDPLEHQIFAADGSFLGANFIVGGDEVNDAGTEVNDELPANTAFFGQMTPNTGVDENGVVHTHPGFNPPGSGGILDDIMFENANFKAAGYQVARFTVTSPSAVPEPASILLIGSGLFGAGILKKKLSKRTK